MRTVTLPTGEAIAAFGLGTWRMGEQPHARAGEVAALRHGLERGVTLIDTAEMYGEGGAEEVVAEAVKGRRDGLFIVSKVYPHNASASGTLAACERSLKRLATDRIDLYLLHWRGAVGLAETVGAFEKLKAAGKIRHWGVSNFDSSDMGELAGVTAGRNCASNQVQYNLAERGIEWKLLAEEQAANRPVMAYSPLGQGGLLAKPVLVELARKHAATPAAVALAFLLSQRGVLVIPKTASAHHLDDNLKSQDIALDAADLAALDRAFPPPLKRTPLAMT